MAVQFYARVVSGVVAELWPHAADAPMPDPQPTPVQVFGEALGSTFVACDGTVQQGWTYDGHSFSAPPPPPPPTAEDLIAYANGVQWQKATGGYTKTVGGASLTFPTDATSQALITGKAVRLGQPNPPATVDWQFPTGFVTMQAADFLADAVKIADFVQATFDTLKTVMTEITAGTITTTAQIDAAFAAVTA